MQVNPIELAKNVLYRGKVADKHWTPDYVQANTPTVSVYTYDNMPMTDSVQKVIKSVCLTVAAIHSSAILRGDVSDISISCHHAQEGLVFQIHVPIEIRGYFYGKEMFSITYLRRSISRLSGLLSIPVSIVIPEKKDA